MPNFRIREQPRSGRKSPRPGDSARRSPRAAGARSGGTTGSAGGQGPHLPKIQGLPIAPAGHGHAVHAGAGEHVEAILRREEVAAAQHEPRGPACAFTSRRKSQELRPS